MSQDDMNNDEFEAYLNGDSPLSDQYHELPDSMPSKDRDQHIRAAAREAIEKHPRVATSPFSSNWGVPVSLAAVLVLSVSIVTLLPDAEEESSIVALDDAKIAQKPASVTAKKAPVVGASQISEAEVITKLEAGKPAEPERRRTTTASGIDSSGMVLRSPQPAQAPLAEEVEKITAISNEAKARQESQRMQVAKQKQQPMLRGLASSDQKEDRVIDDIAQPAMTQNALRPAPTDWLNHIRTRRQLGDLENANIAMDQFIEFFFGKPPYQRRDMLELLSKENKNDFLAELKSLGRDSMVFEEILSDIDG